MAKLTVAEVKAKTKPGRYGDGNGLWLQVQGKEQKSWLLRYTFKGRAREMGLGAVADVPLSKARELAADERAKLRMGMDPIEVRRGQGAAAQVAAGMTFREASERYIEDNRAGWLNPKHAQQWRNTLTTYAYPVIGDKACREVAVPDVEAVLRPVWAKKNETAYLSAAAGMRA